MTTQSVVLPIQSYQSLIYLLCPDCQQLHYFRRVPFQDGSQVRYNHLKTPAPTEFATQCPSCIAMQENDPVAVRAEFDHTANDPMHAKAMSEVAEFTHAELTNQVLACPRCHEAVLFSTDWKGNATTL